MKHKEKVTQILAFSGWTQDRFADLLDVSNSTVRKWLRGRKPKSEHEKVVDEIYKELVEPLICELEKKADKIAKRLLLQQVKDLPVDNTCPI